MKNAIILSTHNTGLAVIRSLGEAQIPVIALYYDKNDMGYVSKYVKQKYFIPHPEYAAKEFLQNLIDLGSIYKDDLLIPADDATLVNVSKNKDLLSKYYTVACTEWSISEKFINKKYTYQIAKSIGVPLPKTIIPETKKEVKDFAKNINYPCMIKPFQSHIFYDYFNIKMFKVFNYDELIAIYDKIYPSNIEVMMQEYIPGEETNGVNYNSYFWDNIPLVEFTAEKVRLSPPDSGVPCSVLSKDIPDVIMNGRKILKAMNFYGYSCTEFKKDERDGIYKFMEVNGRHNRSALLAVKCGINFPALQYEHLINNIIPMQTDYEKNVYWIDITKDLFVSLNYLKRKDYSLRRFLKPYLHKHIFATLNIKDPMPMFKRILSLLIKLIKKIIKKGGIS